MWNHRQSSGNRDLSLFVWIAALAIGVALFMLVFGPNSPLVRSNFILAPSITPSPDPLPDCDGFAEYQTEIIKPGEIIHGPASVVPSPYSLVHELGPILHLELSHQNGWGLNIFSGQSIQIPASITLSDGQVWNVRGQVLKYASDAQLEKNQRCWLIPIFHP
jgi:hypothetical protein